MPVVPSKASAVLPSATIAALLLLARRHLTRLGLACPTAAEIVIATTATRSRAYELRDRLDAVLVELVGPIGRPPKPPPEASPSVVAALTAQTLDFVYRHPGCVHAGAQRSRYSDGFRRFVLDLVAKHPDVDLTIIAGAVGVPAGTLQDWLSAPCEEPPSKPGDEDAPALDPPAGASAQAVQIETVLDEWQRCKGAFTTFCDHLKTHCGIPFGRTLIARIL